MIKLLIAVSIIALRLSAISAQNNQGNCPGGGGCSCICNCGSSGSNTGTNCPPCPGGGMGGGGNGGGGTGGGGGGNTTLPTGAPNQAQCFDRIRAAANLDLGSLVGLLLNTLLSNLVMPILQTVLVGNNTIEGAVIPLANILCFVLGIVLLVLRSIGALGILGMNGLLQNILGPLG